MIKDDANSKKEHRSPKSPIRKSRITHKDISNGAAILQVGAIEHDHGESDLDTDEVEKILETETMDVEKLKMSHTDNQNNISNGCASVNHVSGQWTEADVEKPDTKCQSAGGKKCMPDMKNQRIKEKLIHLTSLMTVLLLFFCVLELHWFLPYYYSITYPILLIIRFIQYFKLEYQYFLLDFCYFGNLFLYISLWAFPDNDVVFMVVFAIANGPLLAAIIPFRNSLVFHDYDRLTSVYIHFMPALLTFSLRWYPSETSKNWYRPFVLQHAAPSFIWLLAVPLTGYVVHYIFYHVLVRVCIQPKPGFVDSYTYFIEKEDGVIARGTSCFCGKKGQFWVYTLALILYTVATLLLVRLWYEYFIAHCVYLAVMLAIAVWNGGTFYIDVFAKKRLEEKGKDKSEDESV